ARNERSDPRLSRGSSQWRAVAIGSHRAGGYGPGHYQSGRGGGLTMADTVVRASTQTVLPGLFQARVERPRVDGSIVFIYALVVVVAVGAGIYSERFRDPGNLTNVLRQTIVLGLLAIGQSIVILAGGIDMSVALIARLSTL